MINENDTQRELSLSEIADKLILNLTPIAKDADQAICNMGDRIKDLEKQLATKTDWQARAVKVFKHIDYIELGHVRRQCPWCLTFEGDGHTDDCKLNKLIQEAKKEKP